MKKYLSLLLMLFFAVCISACGTKYARPDRCVCEAPAPAIEEEDEQPVQEEEPISDELAAALSEEGTPEPEPIEGIKPDENRELSPEMIAALSDSDKVKYAIENAKANENNEIKIDFEKIADRGLYDVNSAVISKNSYEGLDAVADFMKRHSDTTLRVEGHTDSTGKADYNQQLSEQRANSVKKYLVNKGVEASRITTKGFGATKPIADNFTKEGRAQNRRTEMIFKIK